MGGMHLRGSGDARGVQGFTGQFGAGFWVPFCCVCLFTWWPPAVRFVSFLGFLGLAVVSEFHPLKQSHF